MPNQKLSYEYIAGILDGEGYLYLLKKRRKRDNNLFVFPGIRVAITNKDVVSALHKSTGKGSWSGKETRKHKPNSRDIFIWQCFGQKNVLNLLEKVLPFLIVKRKVAKLIIGFCKSRLGEPYHHRGYSDRELNLLNLVRICNKRGKNG